MEELPSAHDEAQSQQPENENRQPREAVDPGQCLWPDPVPEQINA